MLYRSDTVEFKKYKNGSDATFYGNDPPEDTSKLWFDTSVSPPLLKYFSDDEWKEVNDPKVTEEYQALVTKTNKAEEFINGADATITNKCQQVIETEVEGRVVALEDKTSNIVQNPESWTASFSYTKENDDGIKTEEKNSIRMSMDGVDVGDGDSYSRMAKDKFSINIDGQEVAFIDKVKIEVDEVHARNKMKLGNVEFVVNEHGFYLGWAGD